MDNLESDVVIYEKEKGKIENVRIILEEGLLNITTKIINRDEKTILSGKLMRHGMLYTIKSTINGEYSGKAILGYMEHMELESYQIHKLEITVPDDPEEDYYHLDIYFECS